MLARPQTRLLSVLAIFLALTQANLFDPKIINRQNAISSAISSALVDVTGTRDDLTSSTSQSSAAASSTTPASTSAASTSEISSTSSTPTSTLPSSSTSSIASTSSTPPPSSTTSDSSSATSQAATTSQTSQSKATTTPVVTPTPSTSIHVATTVIVKTASGTTYSSTLVSSSTSVATPTTTASLSQDSSKSSSGISTKTKNTIIGVVVGVGGAIILGALFIVAWRIWGRKKNEDESDGLMDFRNSSGHEKLGSAGGPAAQTPFQSTLENYHNPARNANVSSNF